MTAALSGAFAEEAHALSLEAATAEICRAFEGAGVPVILLKGISLRRWLYAPHESREACDIDLLVAPAAVAAAHRILLAHGYEREPFDSIRGDRPTHASDWGRSRGGARIDLHHQLAGTGATAATVWSVLSRSTSTMRVAGADVTVLDEPARAVHVALHALVNGPAAQRPLEDLRRVIAVLSPQQWQEAARVAADLGATSAFATGLRLLPQGAEVETQLDLPRATTLEDRLRAAGAPREALILDWVAHQSLSKRLRFLLGKLLPSRTFLAAWARAAGYRDATAVRAYFYRLGWLARRVVPAVRALRRMRRAGG